MYEAHVFYYQLCISKNIGKTKLYIYSYSYVNIDIYILILNYVNEEFNLIFISLVQINDYDDNSNWQLQSRYNKRDKTCIFFC